MSSGTIKMTFGNRSGLPSAKLEAANKHSIDKAQKERSMGRAREWGEEKAWLSPWGGTGKALILESQYR
ncbi:hypothetical protein GCM10023155_15020 [Bremerella cremea]